MARPVATAKTEPRASNGAARVSKRMFGSCAGELSSELNDLDQRGKELKYPLADARGSVVMPVQKIVPKNKKFQRSTTNVHIRAPKLARGLP
jgi:hypothetical protein